jgi:hypothetical protein
MESQSLNIKDAPLPEFPRDLYWQYSRKLEIYNGLFTKFWQIGNPRFTRNIPTACVAFNKRGDCIDFLFNYDFWQELDEKNRLFIICHELLHVFLSHGKRLQGLNKVIGNLAADVVINEMLVSGFGFIKTEINDWEKYCWFSTVFKDEPNIDKDRNFEFYYRKLYDKAPKVDVKIIEGDEGHDGLEGVEEGTAGKVDELINSLSDEEKEELEKKIKKEIEGKIKEDKKENGAGDKNNKKENNSNDKEDSGQLAGTVAGNIIKNLKKSKIKVKRKWETVIHHWARKHVWKSDKLKDQFVRKHRRFHSVNMKDTFLPTEMEVNEVNKEKRRINLLFVLDTSGSCSHLGERFFNASQSLPKDRFNTKLICFDTKVYPLSKDDIKNRRLYGFGGTYFHIIEEYIQSEVNAGKAYPDACFIVSDGYGNSVNPQYPNRWYWFLTEGGSTHYIPSKSKVYDLKKFE